MILKIVLLTIDSAGEVIINRLFSSIQLRFDLSLVITRQDRPYDTNGNPVVNACKRFNINYLQPSKINNEIALIKSKEPDLIIIANYHEIITNEIIEIPKIGIFNLHSSLLPKMRGATSIIWALKKNMVETGVTLHYVTENIDDGDILMQQAVPITIYDTQASLYYKISIVKYEVLERFITMIQNNNELISHKQNDADATYLPKRKKTDGLIDTEQSIFNIYNHIRSFDPWTGAYIIVENKEIRLRSAILCHNYFESSISNNEIILSKKSSNTYKTIIIQSVTEEIEKPNYFNYELGTLLLKEWINKYK